MMKRFALMFLLFMLFGCTEKAFPDNRVGYDTYNLYDYYVDEYGNEGIVALKLKYEGGSEYVVVLSGDECEAASWGPEEKNLVPFNSDANIGFVRNFLYCVEVNQIAEVYGISDFPAFEWCQSKNKDGLTIHSSSWLLPSHYMLQTILYGRTDLVDSALKRHGLTPLADNVNDYYWTCTEDIDGYIDFAYTGSLYAYDFDPVSRAVPLTKNAFYSPQKMLWQKNNAYRVRAIKIIYHYIPVKED